MNDLISKAQIFEDAVSREAVLNGLKNIAKAKAKSDAQKSMMGRAIFFVEHLPPVTHARFHTFFATRKKCTWMHYDYRTVVPKYHDPDNPYWRIPENKMDALKFCPYCGNEIEMDVRK